MSDRMPLNAGCRKRPVVDCSRYSTVATNSGVTQDTPTASVRGIGPCSALSGRVRSVSVLRSSRRIRSVKPVPTRADVDQLARLVVRSEEQRRQCPTGAAARRNPSADHAFACVPDRHLDPRRRPDPRSVHRLGFLRDNALDAVVGGNAHQRLAVDSRHGRRHLHSPSVGHAEALEQRTALRVGQRSDRFAVDVEDIEHEIRHRDRPQQRGRRRVRCIRRCSSPKSGRPPESSATNSPSRVTDRPAVVSDNAAATSGNEAEMSFPLRENSLTRDVPSTTLTPRWPSHFHSHTQAGPDGSGPAVASIGDNGFGGIDHECPRAGPANHRKPTAGGRTSPPGPPHMGHQFGRTSRPSLTCRGPRPVNPRSALRG